MTQAIIDILGLLCPSCDCISSSNIADMQLHCGASANTVYLTAALVYSSPDGSITASTLINMFQMWLLSEDSPSIVTDGTAVALSQQCPTQLNDATRITCIEVFISETAASDDASAATIMGGFLAGVVAGILGTLLIIAVISKFW